MKTLMDFFEELDEMVYISDVETHQLVYLNKYLREHLGYLTHEDYRNKKCYEVLQKGENPCNFCSCQRTQEHKFGTRIHENPILNQKFVIKDRIIVRDNHRYRIEIAMKVESKNMESISYFYTRSESILNECLQRSLSASSPDDSVQEILECLGNSFHSDRSYIFEFYKDNTTSNTYEWCAEGVVPQKEILQKLSVSDIGYWLEEFEQNKSVVIHDLKDIRLKYPSTYSLLHPQGIHSLVVAPIYKENILRGFIGVDNPRQGTILLLEQVLKSLSSSIATQVERRHLYARFNEMSYRDSLTGAFNRNAMTEHNLEFNNWTSFGAVYCDVNGLKEVNDTQGHQAGNDLIKKCYHLLEKSLDTKWIYRIGGDEFVSLYHNAEEAAIKKDVEALHLAVMQSDCQVSIGYAWSDQLPIDIEEIMNQADMMMYQEKAIYYENLSTSLEKLVLEEKVSLSNRENALSKLKLQRFLSNTYCDISFFLTMLGKDNNTSYFFFGDMQKNLYYISDNMRNRFGFESNIVSNLIENWSTRIQDENMLARFWDDINDLLEQKKEYHDLRYPMIDVDGNNIWIRCFGKIKWNEEKTKPLFFAGRITHQDTSFIVDSLTNFPTETVLTEHLKVIKERRQSCQAIGFCFNHLSQINTNHGRSYGGSLIQQISEKLQEKFSHKAAFYRLSGMRCLALTEVSPLEETEKLIYEIKEIIEECYQKMGLSFHNPCAFALLNYPNEGGSIQDFIENMVSLLKMARQDTRQLYLDNSNGDIQKMQTSSSIEMRLIQDVVNGMNNFRIVIQPVVSAETGEVIGGETLLRWRFEDKEVSPGIFIPIVEKENMSHIVGRWVFEQAVRACSRLLSYSPDFYLTVNASLQQLNDDGLIDFIQQTLSKYNLDGRHIIVEMTESCMDEEPEKLTRFVEACSNMEIEMALDDFGSGYSSMRVLLQYPSSIIKLDRSLLLEMSDSFEKANFIMSIVYACHQFGKRVCIEGVETEFQNEVVKECGCDMIQGFYYYRPMEVNQVYHLLAEKSAEM